MKTSTFPQANCDRHKSLRWMRRLTESVALGICLSLLAALKAQADSFSFTKIADTRSDFPSIVSGPPAINDNGTVVFVARPVSRPSILGNIFEIDEVRGVYTSDGEQITEIVKNSLLPSLFNSSNRPSQYFILREVDINNNGTVAFSVASLPEERIGIFTNLGGAFTNRSKTAYGYLMVGLSGLRLDLTLNNQDDLVYKSVFDRKSGPTTSDLILSRVNQPDVTIGAAGSYIGIQNEFAELGNFAFNNQGIVTFAARKGGENTKSIFTSDGSSRTTLLNSTDYVSFFVNDRGDVVLSNNNSIGVLDSADGTVRTLADTNSGLFQSFLFPVNSNFATINNNRQVAFTATLKNGETGIFTGTYPTTNKVIATGDSLYGSTVISVGFAREGLNNFGQIAIFARLADGTEGIYRANQVSETPPPQPEPSPQDAFRLSLIIDTKTAIPDGTGNFNSFESPLIDGENIVFRGLDLGSRQEGIYKISNGVLNTIADRNTTIPNSSRTFSSFSNLASNGGNVVFGSGYSSEGIFIKRGENPLTLVSDRNTPIPNGTGNFSSFSSFVPDGNNVVFVGGGTNGQQGIYISRDGTLQVVADTNTPIPNGTGNFSSLNFIAVDGNNVVFVGGGTNGQQGIYISRDGTLQVVVDTSTPFPTDINNISSFSSIAVDGNVVLLATGITRQGSIYTSRDGTLQLVADTNTPIPGGSGNFFEFSSVFLTKDGNNVIFLGQASQQQQGIYISRNGALQTIADTNTTVPGSLSKFSGFSNLVVDGDNLAFIGSVNGLPLGIYAYIDGNLLKVADFGVRLNDLRISSLSLNTKALQGNSLLFTATFTDGTKALLRADLK